MFGPASVRLDILPNAAHVTHGWLPGSSDDTKTCRGSAMLSKPALWLALLTAAVIALAPVLAEARAGGGSSMGSRGTRTFNSAPATPTAPTSRPVERSMTQPQQPSRPLAPAPLAQPSFFRSHPFMSRLMGGLIGAGIGGLLFGHGFFGGGFGLGVARIRGLPLH